KPQPQEAHGFNGLRSPRWPADILPRIDEALAAQGAVLYHDNCESCHLPPVDSPGFWASDKWLPPNAAGERYLHVRLIDIPYVGTDSAQAEDMLNRTVEVRRELGVDTNSFGEALGKVVENTVDYWYDKNTPPVPEA